MARLTGKIAVVTGAGRGIGRATAKLFAAEGATVAVLSLTPANIDSVVADIEAAGGTALGVVCDISNADQIKAAVDKVVAVYGGIDILVNNAFDPTAPFSSIIDLSVEQLQRNFEMGPIAYLRTMQACYPYLKTSGEGRVINFGSMAGVIGLMGYGPYNMAKEAVRALTRTAAREWGVDKITVNNIMPLAETWDKTVDVPAPTNALARFGTPEEDIARPLCCSSRPRMLSSSRATALRRMAARSSTAPAEPGLSDDCPQDAAQRRHHCRQRVAAIHDGQGAGDLRSETTNVERASGRGECSLQGGLRKPFSIQP